MELGQGIRGVHLQLQEKSTPKELLCVPWQPVLLLLVPLSWPRGGSAKTPVGIKPPWCPPALYSSAKRGVAALFGRVLAKGIIWKRQHAGCIRSHVFGSSDRSSVLTSIDDTLAEIGDIRHGDQIPAFLARLCAAYGMNTVAYLGTGALNRRLPRREPYLAVTYSSEWIEHYRAKGYLKIDPVVQVGLRRLLPLDWDDFARENQSLRQFFGEAAEFGLGRKGMSFPVHGHSGDRALFSVSADMSEREWQWVRRTAFRQFPVIAVQLHDAVLRTEGIERAHPHLSRRELECLRWTSEGKTVWECGMILSLSPHTVRCYLESARHKLGASSNTHAVSIALKSGLLFDLP